MSFIDWRFLLFLPTVFALHYLIAERYRWLLLLVASYVFYMAWKPEYGLILFAITCVDYVSGLMMGLVQGEKRRRVWLLFSLISNLGILFYFKYFNFVFGSIQALLRALGAGIELPVVEVLLPIGISFHVFQSISYTIDVYMRRVDPVRHFGKFALFVSFFPQLVAGPIERPTGLLQQLFEHRPFDLALARQGAKRIAWGYFKKLVIADRIAPIVTAVYSAPADYPGPSLMFATILFSYQIYCDFSGYTDIARGTANLFGYELMKNFDAPYTAKSVAEFWRRWHISLSSWFRDYVYIPLGGNRVTSSRKAMNIMITFLLSGLWHGANWTYVIWGGLNGVFLVVGDWTKTFRNKLTGRIFVGWRRWLRPLWQIITTFGLISFSWIFFRASDISSAWYIVTHLMSEIPAFIEGLQTSAGQAQTLFMGSGADSLLIGLAGIVFMEMIHWLRKNEERWKRLNNLPRPLRFTAYYAFVMSILLFGRFVDNQQFIYFQF